MKIVAIHQPNFLPWLGFFYKVQQADCFCILDDVQYSKNSYINRCKIKTSQGEFWLTIPVSAKLGTPISEVTIANNNYQNKVFKNLKVNYSRSKHFEDIFEWLEKVWPQTNSLFDLNYNLFKSILKTAKIDKQIVLSSSIPTQGKNDDRLIEIIQHLDGNVYLSGKGGSNYQDPEKFTLANIELAYTQFFHPVYQQLWGDFTPGLSVLDYLFNYGFENLGNIMQ